MCRLLGCWSQIFYLLRGRLIYAECVKRALCLVTSWCISSIDRLVVSALHLLIVVCCRMVRRTLMIFFILVSLITFSPHIALWSRWVSILWIWMICCWPWISLSNEIVNDVLKSLSRIDFPFTHGILQSLCLFEFIQIWLWIIWALSWMFLFHFIFKFYFCFHLWLWVHRVFCCIIHNVIAHFSMCLWPILGLSNFVFGKVREIPVLLWNFGLIVLHFSRKFWIVKKK